MHSSFGSIRRFVPLALVAVAVGVAQGSTWNNSGNGDWTTVSNWKENRLPGGHEFVTNDCGGTVCVESGMDVTAGSLRFGTASGKSGKLSLTGGKLTLTEQTAQIGGAGGSSGAVTMTGGELVCRQFQIGATGNGTMVLSGGVVHQTDYSCIGRYAGGVGKLTITGNGVWECGDGTSYLFVAEQGVGELTIENGGEFRHTPGCTGFCLLGNNSAGRGTLYLNEGGTLRTSIVDVRYAGNTFVLNGGVIAANKQRTGDFIYGAGVFSIGAKGGVIDTLDGSLNVTAGLNDAAGGASGVLVKEGTGTLALKGLGNFSGGYAIAEGTLSAASSLNLPGYATAPITVAAGATLALGSGWTDAQVNALTNRAGFALAEGATLTRATPAEKADFVIDVASGNQTLAGGLDFGGKRVVKTGAGTLVLSGHNDFPNGFAISNGTVTADYEASGLKETHLVIAGGTAGAPAFLRVMGTTFTPPLGTSGDGTVEFGAYGGLLPGVGPLTVNFFNDGRLLAAGKGGFNVTDIILGDNASWPVTLVNGLDINGRSNFTIKSRNGAWLHCNGGFTNTAANADSGQFNFWDGKIAFGDTPGWPVDFHTYRFWGRSGTVLFTNATIRMRNDLCAGYSGADSGVSLMTFKDCDKDSVGGWDYVNGSTGTVMTIDGGKYTAPNNLNVGYTTGGKTGTLVITNDAQVKAGALRMYSGWARQDSGRLELGSSWIGFTNKVAGAGLATYWLSGGEIYFPDGKNFQIGAWGDGLLWQTGGDINASSYPCIGRYPSGRGEYRLHGGTFMHRKQSNNSNLFFVSEEGEGLMSIANGGRLESEYEPGVQISSKATSSGTLILSPGGTAVVNRVFGASGSKDCALVFNGGTIQPRTNSRAAKFLDDNIRRVVVTPYGGAFDTNGKGDFTIGRPLAAATAALDLSESLAHRWSFTDGSLVDSIGGKAATVSGAVEYPEGALRLLGTKQGTSCVNLGTDLIPTDGRGLTIETWFTLNKHVSWARLFNFGKDNNELYYALNRGGTSTPQFTVNKIGSVVGKVALQPGKSYHLAVSIAPQPTQVWLVRVELRDAATGELLDSGSMSKPLADFSLAQITQSNGCWLGHSSFTADNDPAADYHDVRIHHREMTSAQMAESAAAGADHIYAFRKQGANKLTLSGANAYRCGTAVDQGTLALADDATLPATEWVVAKGAALQLNLTPQTASDLVGEGTVRSGAVTVTGTIQPGGIGKVGILTLDGTALSGGELVIDVDAEGNVDCLKATGTLNLTGVSLRVRNAEALDRDATYVIATANAIVGGFASVDLPKRWTASVVGGRVVLSRNNGMAVIVR